MTGHKNASRPSGATACFLILAYGLTWMVQVPVALANHHLLHVHVSNKLQNMAQVAPAIAFSPNYLAIYIRKSGNVRGPWRSARASSIGA